MNKVNFNSRVNIVVQFSLKSLDRAKGLKKVLAHLAGYRGLGTFQDAMNFYKVSAVHADKLARGFLGNEKLAIQLCNQKNALSLEENISRVYGKKGIRVLIDKEKMKIYFLAQPNNLIQLNKIKLPDLCEVDSFKKVPIPETKITTEKRETVPIGKILLDKLKSGAVYKKKDFFADLGSFLEEKNLPFLKQRGLTFKLLVKLHQIGFDKSTQLTLTHKKVALDFLEEVFFPEIKVKKKLSSIASFLNTLKISMIGIELADENLFSEARKTLESRPNESQVEELIFRFENVSDELKTWQAELSEQSKDLEYTPDELVQLEEVLANFELLFPMLEELKILLKGK